MQLSCHPYRLQRRTSSFVAALSWGLGIACLIVLCSTVSSAAEPAVIGNAVVHAQHDYEWPLSRLKEPEAANPKDLSWCQNPVDAYVLEKLEERGLKPSPKADKLTLLRRITLDLTGMLPTRSEQDAFLADQSPDAYHRVVDRLLDSVRYGERFAQPWLDLVRYAESDGFKSDALRSNAHKYRDYVIQAFNTDLPYDRFLQQQLAGDELEPDNPQALIATGYNRLYPDEVQASDIVVRRQELLDDVTDVTAQAMLGLTVGCARCHDHKFDPISQKNYYELQAFFAPMIPRDDLMAANRRQEADYEDAMDRWEKATTPIHAEMDKLLAILREQKMAELTAPYDSTTKEAIATPEENRTPYQQQLFCQAQKFMAPRMKKLPGNLDGEAKVYYDELDRQLTQFEKLKPVELPGILGVVDVSLIAPETHVLATGSITKPLETVQPDFLDCLDADPVTIQPMESLVSTGRRAALAQWLTQKTHPLTSRVMVNRLWMQLMGEGIVATPNDFGVMGQPPSHRKLLDWLAAHFVANNWSTKEIVETIVTSNTYQQASLVDAEITDHREALTKDPQNKLLWHANRKRLSGETIRDIGLQVSGQLNQEMFGKSARPALPPALQQGRYGWEADANLGMQNRRSIYVVAMRNMRYPLFQAFDQPDRISSCPQRTTTVSAPQSLVLLNGLPLDLAKAWAERLSVGENHPRGVIEQAYQELLGRLPSPSERDLALQFVTQQTQMLSSERHAATQVAPAIVGQVSTAPAAPTSEAELKAQCQTDALVDFCHMLLLSNPALHVD